MQLKDFFMFSGWNRKDQECILFYLTLLIKSGYLLCVWPQLLHLPKWKQWNQRVEGWISIKWKVCRYYLGWKVVFWKWILVISVVSRFIVILFNVKMSEVRSLSLFWCAWAGESTVCCVRPVLLYCCEMWELTVGDAGRLHQVECNMIRMLCGVRLLDRVSTDVVHDRVVVVLKIHLLWYGHVIRGDIKFPNVWSYWKLK